MGEFKRVKAKIIGKHELEKDWEQSSYVPDIGEAVYYDPEIDEEGNPDPTKAVKGRDPITITRQKNGDGIKKVADLPFISDGNINLIPNELGSIIQKGNRAIAENSAVFGNHNQSYAEFNFIEGNLNLSGVYLKDEFKLDIKAAVIWTDQDTKTRYTQITLNSLPENLDFINDPAVIIHSNKNYYSCRFFKLEGNELYLENHNAAGAIKKDIQNKIVDQIVFYRVTQDNGSEECHTEHVEGAYNISGQGNIRDDMASKSSHIEGHTNINTGPYNHVEGVTNKVLNAVQFTHVEGRGNIVDSGDVSTASMHVEGEENTVGSASYSHIGGYQNVVNSTTRSTISGSSNEVNGADYTNIGGHANDIQSVTSALVHGETLTASGENNKVVLGKHNKKNEDALVIIGGGTSSNKKNVLEISKDGELSYYNKESGLVKLDAVLDNIVAEASEKIQKVADDSLKARKEIISNEDKKHQAVIESIENVDLKIELNDKEQVGSINSMFDLNMDYYVPQEEDFLAITDISGISKIQTCSKNILNANYQRKSSSLGGITQKAQKDGSIKLVGKWTSGNAQLTIYDTQIHYFEPGITYRIGRISKEDPKIEFRFVYYKNGQKQQIALKGLEEQWEEFTWDENCSQGYLLIQAPQKSEYLEDSPAYVYPYIYIKGRESVEWVSNEFIDYSIPETQYLYTKDIGYINFKKELTAAIPSIVCDKYKNKNYAKEADVIDKVNTSLTEAKNYTNEEINKAKSSTLTSAKEYTNSEINKINEKFNAAIGNYKIQVVEYGTEMTDPDTIYFVLE